MAENLYNIGEHEPTYFAGFYSMLEEFAKRIENQILPGYIKKNIENKARGIAEELMSYYRDEMENSSDYKRVNREATLNGKIIPVSIIDKHKISFLRREDNEELFSINTMLTANKEKETENKNRIFMLANLPEKTGTYVTLNKNDICYFVETGNMYRKDMGELSDGFVPADEAERNCIRNFKENLKAGSFLSNILDGAMKECEKYVTEIPATERSRFYLDAANEIEKFYIKNGFNEINKETGNIGIQMQVFTNLSGISGKYHAEDGIENESIIAGEMLDIMYPYIPERNKEQVIEKTRDMMNEENIPFSGVTYLGPKEAKEQIYLKPEDIVNEIKKKIYERDMKERERKPKLIITAKGVSEKRLLGMLTEAKKTVYELRKIPVAREKEAIKETIKTERG